MFRRAHDEQAWMPALLDLRGGDRSGGSVFLVAFKMLERAWHRRHRFPPAAPRRGANEPICSGRKVARKWLGVLEAAMPEGSMGLTDEDMAPDEIEPLGPEDEDPADPEQKARPSSEFTMEPKDPSTILNDSHEVEKVVDPDAGVLQ
jgi:hypothetical protein